MQDLLKIAGEIKVIKPGSSTKLMSQGGANLNHQQKMTNTFASISALDLGASSVGRVPATDIEYPETDQKFTTSFRKKLFDSRSNQAQNAYYKYSEKQQTIAEMTASKPSSSYRTPEGDSSFKPGTTATQEKPPGQQANDQRGGKVSTSPLQRSNQVAINKIEELFFAVE